MIFVFALFSMCLWCMVDVTDEVKAMSVMEGESFTLNTDVTDTQKYLLIQWTFRDARIAEINKFAETNSTFDADARFRDRLNLDQTGSLTVKNTRTTDSGLYKLAIVNQETRYRKFNVTVCASSRNISSSGRSSSDCVSSSPALNDSIVDRTEDANVTELYQTSSECIQRCSFTEAVIRLALSALVGVVAVAVLVYDVRSARSELDRTEETEYLSKI